MAKLTDKQTLFISEYCIDCNATRAALAAGYSEDTAAKIGWENLQKPEIAKAVREKLLEMASRAEITAGAVLRELALLAFADMGQYNTIDEDGNVRMDFRQMGPDGMRAVKKIKQEVQFVGDANEKMPILKTEFELYDKQAALDKLMRYMGLYAKDNERKVEHSGEVNVKGVDAPPAATSIDEWMGIKAKVDGVRSEQVAALAREVDDG
jgi:phage terminase small subunit